VRLFKCQACAQVLYFENTLCGRCSHRLGYLPKISCLSALEQKGDIWQPLTEHALAVRFCANAEFDACNWVVDADAGETLCLRLAQNSMINTRARAKLKQSILSTK
jgi:hypothetical protein